MYGENSSRLRAELATLLGQYRVRHRVLRDVTTMRSTLGIEARQTKVSAQVRRYRRTILAWSHQALTDADPNPKASSDHSRYEPPEWLRRSLGRLLKDNPDPLPSMDDLTTEQPIAILETWRQAAKATVLAEHDFARGLGEGLLDHREWLTLVGDVADITKAILVLDKRYRHLPGWETLRGIRHLDRYVEECSPQAQTRYGVPDYNIDWRGWRPPGPQIAANADQITHVLAAEHRLLNSLKSVPSMANLRHLLTSQRELSHLAAERAINIAPEQAARFRHREQTYATLGRAARSAGGLAGTGAAATRHSADAAQRLVTIPVGEPIPVDAVRNLDKLFRHVDNAIGAAIEHGFNTRIYLVRRTLPRIDPTDGRLAHQARQLFEPLRREGDTPLIAVARRHLRTDSVRMAAPGDSADRRLYAAPVVRRAAAHRPE
jgi:hypothetical protein